MDKLKSIVYCIADNTTASQHYLNKVKAKYPEFRYEIPPTKKKAKRTKAELALNETPIVIVIGGDGFMLHTLHDYIGKNYKFYGINAGRIGFLMNSFELKHIPEKLLAAEETVINLLELKARDAKGKKYKSLAINEVSLFRQYNQAARMNISINGKTRLENLVGDGLLIATPAGSSAYNLSAGGSIIPFNSNLLSITSLNANRPRRWNGALIPNNFIIDIEVMESSKRPVSVTADYIEFRNIKHVTVSQSKDYHLTLLFNPDHGLEERLFNEQFV